MTALWPMVSMALVRSGNVKCNQNIVTFKCTLFISINEHSMVTVDIQLNDLSGPLVIGAEESLVSSPCCLSA